MGGFFMMISKYNSLISCQTKETPPASMKQEGFLWKGIWLILYIKNDYTCTYLKEITGVMTQ